MENTSRIRSVLCVLLCVILLVGCGARGGWAPAPVPEVTPVMTPAPVRAAHDTAAVRLEGTPSIPPALRARMNQYLNMRSAGLTDLAADGGRVLVTTRFGNTAQVHLVRAPRSARTQLTFEDEPVRDGLFDPRVPDAVLYLADEGGNEQHQIFRLDLGTGRSVRLTEAGARCGAPLWSPDGAHIAYGSNARNGRDFDIWIADGRDRASARRLVEVEGWWSPLGWSPDARWLVLGESISINESRVHLVEVATRRVTPLSPGDQRAAYPEALFGADGQTLYVTSDREGEYLEIYETDREGSEWYSLTRGIPWDVEQMALTPDGDTLAFTTNEGGISVLHLLDTRSRTSRPVQGLPRGIVSGLRCARRAPVLGFTLHGATRGGDAYTYDLARRALTRWTESELGGLDPAQLLEPELIEYESFDGRTIPAFFSRPRGPGPFPVVVMIHGGPESQARPAFAPLAQFLLVESGIAVIAPNVRGSAGYGKTYLTLDNGMQREDSVRDIGALLDWIEAHPELDGRRVGVYGGSYGGYMVLASLIHFGERIAAGVDVVGISNFVTFLTNTAEYRRDLRRVEYGDERDQEMRAFLERISPLASAHRIRSALFVAQGANDPRVPASEAEQIVQAVRAAGQDVWYLLAHNEGHGFARKENRDLFHMLTVMFFERHLLPAR